MSSWQKFAQSIDQMSRRYWDCDKKKLGSSTDKPSIKRFRATRYRALKFNIFSLDSLIDLHGFNTWTWNNVSWSIKNILDLPKYKISAFCQRISQLHKIVTYVPNKWITYVLTYLFIFMRLSHVYKRICNCLILFFTYRSKLIKF